MEAFSLKATKKSIEGGSHVDQDGQFQYTNRIGKAFEAKGQSVISVDCKKKELIGNAQEQGERIASQRTRDDCERKSTPLPFRSLHSLFLIDSSVAVPPIDVDPISGRREEHSS
jgi:Rhodopirellula transposase DDE domain